MRIYEVIYCTTSRIHPHNSSHYFLFLQLCATYNWSASQTINPLSVEISGYMCHKVGETTPLDVLCTQGHISTKRWIRSSNASLYKYLMMTARLGNLQNCQRDYLDWLRSHNIPSHVKNTEAHVNGFTNHKMRRLTMKKVKAGNRSLNCTHKTMPFRVIHQFNVTGQIVSNLARLYKLKVLFWYL